MINKNIMEELVVKGLPLNEINTTNRVQIQEDAVCILDSSNNLGKILIYLWVNSIVDWAL